MLLLFCASCQSNCSGLLVASINSSENSLVAKDVSFAQGTISERSKLKKKRRYTSVEVKEIKELKF